LPSLPTALCPFHQKLHICYNYSPEIYNKLKKIGLYERGLSENFFGIILETPKDSRKAGMEI
jgi:hypothetical protein